MLLIPVHVNTAEATNSSEIVRFDQECVNFFPNDHFADSVRTHEPQISTQSSIPGTIVIMIKNRL